MFVPLPVPFMFQRASPPDLSAWRLKSPSAPRTDSASVSPGLPSRQAGNIHGNLSILQRSIPGPLEAERERG
ncbi:hypothetical protein DPEC_G00144280 [Dallia pectoralis]|uniref:Uncharacterized protein n=1 Tax=Dallia pectoralis TaxID=75939 RepID=A0ACC2GNY3_DALPE|nr:hypothetical protein DPEC_G00144280 [Dallia pectoralis]